MAAAPVGKTFPFVHVTATAAIELLTTGWSPTTIDVLVLCGLRSGGILQHH